MNKWLSVFYHVSSLEIWNRLYLNAKVFYSAYWFPHIFFHIITQLESNTPPSELPLYKLHIFGVVIIIWNLSFLRRQFQLEVEQMFTTYWIVITWRLDWGGTWHAELGLIILVTMLLGLLILWLVKVKIKYFWFDTCVHNWSVTWLCGWGSLILSHHPAKFGVHRLCESGDITFFICHVTTISKCHMTL